MIIRASIARVQSAISALQGRRAKTGLARPLSTLASLLFLGGATVLSAPASAIEPHRLGQEAFLTHAVFADGRLWLLSDAGDLSSVAEGQDTRVVEALPEKAFDLCVLDRHPMVITGAYSSEWTLRRRAGGAWSVVAAIQTEGDLLLAMDCAANRVTLLTTRRLIDLNRNGQNTVMLSEMPNRGSVIMPYGTPDHFFVGINAGEWGGGLRRIDRHDGKVTVIEHNATGELCGGPLNTSCDPVTGIVSVPWKPGCIAAAVGLVHFRSHGRVVEVCGDQVKRLYYKPYGDKPSGGSTKDDEPFSAVAFFGLTRDADTLWAVGVDGIYSIGPDGSAKVVPLPRFKEIGGISLSFELPEFVLVLTNVNQRRSISGAVPILVPRR
jgi:hypothetical protein